MVLSIDIFILLFLLYYWFRLAECFRLLLFSQINIIQKNNDPVPSINIPANKNDVIHYFIIFFKDPNNQNWYNKKNINDEIKYSLNFDSLQEETNSKWKINIDVLPKEKDGQNFSFEVLIANNNDLKHLTTKTIDNFINNDGGYWKISPKPPSGNIAIISIFNDFNTFLTSKPFYDITKPAPGEPKHDGTAIYLEISYSNDISRIKKNTYKIIITTNVLGQIETNNITIDSEKAITSNGYELIIKALLTVKFIDDGTKHSFSPTNPNPTVTPTIIFKYITEYFNKYPTWHKKDDKTKKVTLKVENKNDIVKGMSTWTVKITVNSKKAKDNMIITDIKIFLDYSKFNDMTERSLLSAIQFCWLWYELNSICVFFIL